MKISHLYKYIKYHLKLSVEGKKYVNVLTMF